MLPGWLFKFTPLFFLSKKSWQSAKHEGKYITGGNQSQSDTLVLITVFL
jgi:hypothetical protein